MKNKYLVLLFALCIFVVGCSNIEKMDNNSDGIYNDLLTKISELEKKTEDKKQIEKLNEKIVALEENNKKLTEGLELTNKNLENVIKEKDSLKENYNSLKVNYDSLKNNYNSLKSNYDSLSGKINSQNREFYYVTFIGKSNTPLAYGNSPSGVVYSQILTLPTDKNGYVIKAYAIYPYPRPANSFGCNIKYSKEDGTSVDITSKFTSDTVVYVTCE